jgi:lysophospholipase L1-like esterase
MTCIKKVHVWFLALLALGAAARLSAQQILPSERFEKDIQRFEAADRKSPPPQGAILFIGSSSVVRWKTLAEDFPDYKVINRGFGGSYIADATYFADRIVIPYKPRLIVLRSGTNDIFDGMSPERVFADFQAFVTAVRAKLPKTRIVFMALNPSPDRWANFPKETKANNLIRAFCTAERNLDYVDIVPGMLGPDGKPRPEIYASDKLHPNAEGYKLWTAQLRPHLQAAAK